MKTTQRLSNNQWIAHDTTTTDVLPKTLRCSLVDCQAAYIKEHFLTEPEKMLLVLKSVSKVNPEEYSSLEIVEMYEDLLPKEIEFVTVTLIPRWETTIKAVNK